jgi:hypothetical protein
MKVNELIKHFGIFTSNEEEKVLEQLKVPAPVSLSSFSERDQVVIESLIRKSLVIKIGSTDPKVIANDFK